MKKIALTTLFLSLLILLPDKVLAQNEALFISAAGTPSAPRVPMVWNKYYTNAGITDFCRKLEKA
ncbi:MAG TPA: hypothetical protein PLZ75_06675, partial [Bacteroidales bacterium]|nr:hypothetical protein [Bacteroidales bacterium]